MKTLIKLENLHKSYGEQVLFESASASFSDDQKIGVIGRNGAGKSTLCRILTGQEEADAGSVWKSPELRLGYVEQHDPWSADETILGFLTRYTGREEWECAKTAWEFEISNDMMNSRIREFSGGFRTRVKLTALLVIEPNFLVLDEPSNYLDLRTLILLENFLRNFRGSCLIVSHDREFLKRTCEDTLEIENGELALYPGTVHDYLLFKAEEKQRIEQYNKNLGVKQRQLERFIERFRAKASKASQARSKQKQLDRLNSDVIETDHPLDDVRIRLPSIEKRAGLALRIEKLSVGYPTLTVAKGINLEVDRSRRIAVLGDNGQGKTTFLRTIAGDLPPLAGKFTWSHGLQSAYYAQHVYSNLDESLDVYSTLASMAARDTPDQDIFDLAGCFLFKGDDVRKKIGVLSGGERSRVCLAGLLLAKKPVLLLDEPTNHLDFETVEALGRALRGYNGTIFFICHDRTFVSLVADTIIEVKNGSVEFYPGTYAEYVYSLETKVRDAHLPEDGKAHSKKTGSPGDGSGNPVPDGLEEHEIKSRFETRKKMAAERRKLAGKLEDCEERQKEIRREQLRLHAVLENDPAGWTRELALKYDDLKKELTAEEERWLSLQSGIEEIDRIISGLKSIASGPDRG